MIERVVAFSLAHRLLVALAVAVLVVLGIRAYVDLPVDAVPDITNVQVQVLTNAPGLAPLEVEQLVTRPVELAMAGLPGVTQVRSTSRTSVSAVTIVFTDDTDLAYARSLVSQRLPAAREAIPPSANRPDLGPLTTGLGEVVHFTMEWPGHEPRELRTVFDWEIARALRQVPGVVEVNAWGAGARQIEVRLRPADMQAHGVTQHDVEEALLSAGQSGGGGALDRGQDQVLVRFDGPRRGRAPRRLRPLPHAAEPARRTHRRGHDPARDARRLHRHAGGGLSGNLMSLGAIDFGLVVDGAIIIVENAVRHLSERHAKEGRALTPEERDEVVLTSSLEVRSATAFGELIIALVYLPILTLEGVEGKMFRPMALTVVFALATAFVLSLTLTPVLASLLLPLRLEEKESWIVVAAREASTAHSSTPRSAIAS
jgi:Cu/Ag efflux pump CusA